ncbi:MAG: ABC-2 family transporter protein [Candidatus Dojkabacteria bacterium]|nr:MAG: ABC-2 family transporter protein [Candidatus Dojkabacteria bacterium]
MKYYMRLWLLVVKRSLNRDMVHRPDFLTKVFRAFFVVATQLLIVWGLFGESGEVAGWSRNQFILLLGYYNLVNYLGWGIFNVNLWRLEERVMKGEFDYFMLSPAGSLFQASFGEFFIDDAITSLSGAVMVIYYFVAESESLSLWTIPLAILMLIIALVIWYGLHLVVASISLWKVETGFMDLMKGITRIGAFPTDIYPAAVQLILYTLFPVAFIATVPAEILIGESAIWMVGVAASIAVLFLIVGIGMWRLMLNRYSSAGS